MTTEEHIQQVINEMNSGIEFTQVCGKFYSNKAHPFGQRVFAITRAALLRMLERKIIHKQGQRLLLTENEADSN